MDGPPHPLALLATSPRKRGEVSELAATAVPQFLPSCRLMSAAAEPLQEQRRAGELLPALMLLVVLVASAIILAHLAVALWLA